MNGFEIFLCIFFGIIAFIVLLLSIPAHVTMAYDEKIHLSLRYLFLKFEILPLGEKKPKKQGKKKKEKPTEETVEEPKEKKPNRILSMVKAVGYDGMIEIICNAGNILKKYGGKLTRSIIFDEIQLYISVGCGDAAATAIKYGKTCQQVYPVLGYICSNNVVRKYNANVEADFLANNSSGEFYFDFHMTVRKILNATIAMAVRMVFKVLLKFLKGAKNKTEEKPQPTQAQEVKAEKVN